MKINGIRGDVALHILQVIAERSSSGPGEIVACSQPTITVRQACGKKNTARVNSITIAIENGALIGAADVTLNEMESIATVDIHSI